MSRDDINWIDHFQTWAICPFSWREIKRFWTCFTNAYGFQPLSCSLRLRAWSHFNQQKLLYLSATACPWGPWILFSLSYVSSIGKKIASKSFIVHLLAVCRGKEQLHTLPGHLLLGLLEEAMSHRLVSWLIEGLVWNAAPMQLAGISQQLPSAHWTYAAPPIALLSFVTPPDPEISFHPRIDLESEKCLLGCNVKSVRGKCHWHFQGGHRQGSSCASADGAQATRIIGYMDLRGLLD